MADIFEEVDEALQREKMERIWKQYGAYIIAGLVGLVLLTAATVAYLDWNNRQNEAETTRLVAALSDPDPVAALSDLAQETRPGHRVLGRLVAAGESLQAGDIETAANSYEAVLNDRQAPQIFRDLALLMHVRLIAGQEGANAQDLVDRLSVLWRGRNPGPFAALARIEAALIKAHLDQDYAQALTHLDAVAGRGKDQVPITLLERTQMLKKIYTHRQEG